MTTEEVGRKVVELTRKQAWHEAVNTLYADDITSVEAQSMGGGSPEAHGIDAIRGKTEWWVNTMDVHNLEVTGPWVAHDRFVVQYNLEFGEKGKQERMKMSEVGVYTVKDGKIVREEFLPLVQ
jgi:CRISPR type IV-associated protein Csf3